MLEIKRRIEDQTWKRFSSMIWKKNTFGNCTISDNYEISVYNTTGNEMTGSLSATEYMALAYSFTLAIHDASGKNCPLVVDSPLGRVSDENRSKMATELLKVSKNKQIIMLFTPDEYSDEVSTVYDNGAASIRDIYLSAAEDEIDTIGV
jgi:DNA sulfur modification protein DndD